MADRKRIIKQFLTSVVIVGFIGLIIVFIRFRSSQGPPPPTPDEAGEALMTLAKVHQTATKNGRIQWELDAQSAQLKTDGKQMVLKAPRVVFYMEDGGIVHLAAEHGVLNTMNNDMKVHGNVRLNNDRYTLLTEALDYRHDERLLESHVPVKITSYKLNLRADTMRYDIDKGLANFNGRVQGDLNEDLAF